MHTFASKIGLACGALLLLLGCTGKPIDPARVEASVVRFGEFEIRAGKANFLGERIRIACELGRTFGIDYRIDVPEGSVGPIPVRFRWIHPRRDIPRLGISGDQSSGGPASPELPRGATSIEGRSLWMITHPEERIPGRYTIQIETLDGSRIILAKEFEIDGC